MNSCLFLNNLYFYKTLTVTMLPKTVQFIFIHSSFIRSSRQQRSVASTPHDHDWQPCAIPFWCRMESHPQCGGATSDVDDRMVYASVSLDGCSLHTDGLPQGSMCRDVTLQPYNMAKQLQPPPVDCLLYMRESRGIQNFVTADEMEPLESQYLTMRAGMEGFQTPKVLPWQCPTL